MQETVHLRPPRRKRFAVLVIDDSESDRRLTELHLGKAWPFEHELVIHFAGNGREALQRIRETRYAIIVLDWRLPDMDGDQLLQYIRSQGVATPVIVISGLQRDAINADFQARGAAFLNKDDMNPHTFHEAIASSLELLGLKKPQASDAPASPPAARPPA